MNMNAHVKVLEQLHMYATYRGETERAAALEAAIDALKRQPTEGEEIMVNTPYDVFILPLRPSGLDGNSPRFVVHVPDLERAQT